MAPEWVFNLLITSKVDVYSFEIVILEMVTGKNAASDIMQHPSLVTWLREKQKGGYIWRGDFLGE